MRPRPWLVAVAATLAFIPSPIGAAPGGAVPPPARGAYVGAYPGIPSVLPEVTSAQLQDMANRSGHHLAFVVFRSPWDRGFPLDAVRTVASHNAIPLIQWEPWAAPYDEGSGPGTYTLDDIAAGKHDAYIRWWTDAARRYGKRVMVVFADEMNGDWFPWSGVFHGSSAHRFRAAWSRIVTIARQRGAHNIAWVWQPASESTPAASWNDVDRYYPGAGYVDWVGASLFGKQYPDEEWRGFVELMDPIYAAFARLDRRRTKPWMLVEWGVTEDPRKPQWIADGLRLMPTRYPGVRAAGWWDARFETEDGAVIDLRINSSEAARAAYVNGIRYPQWVDQPR